MLRPAVDSLRVRGHLDWRRANEHGHEAHLVVDELEKLLNPATADEMLPLVERAIDHLIRAILRSDDSSGIQGDAVARLFVLHEKAAGLGHPDPKKLVKCMIKVGFAEHGFFHVDPVPYADALGGPLDGPYRFANLVEALLESGADDEALDYAVRGVTVSPVAHQTIPLYETAVRMLREHRRIMTTFAKGRVRADAVTAVISGNRDLPLMQSQKRRFAGYDGRLGVGPMPEPERQKLLDIVARAHEAGYRVRFWATPDQPGTARDAIWQELIDAGVDHINTDDLEGLETFLRERA